MGIFKSKLLSLVDIEKEIKETEEKISKYTENLKPGSEKDL